MTVSPAELPHPTLGIEIEIPWRNLIARVDPEAAVILTSAHSGFHSIEDPAERAYVQRAISTVEREYTGGVREARRRGIPTSGNDGFVEFALEPRNEPGDILADVSTLHGLDLMREGERYSLHITIGGVAARSSVSYLLGAVEIVGNIRPERVLQRGTWDLKCFGGMKYRPKEELQFGMTSGVEFRTPEYYSLHQLADMLHVSQLGAIAMNHYPDIWASWQQEFGAYLRSNGLPTNKLWRNYDRDTWERFAWLLGDQEQKDKARHIISEHTAALN